MITLFSLVCLQVSFTFGYSKTFLGFASFKALQMALMAPFVSVLGIFYVVYFWVMHPTLVYRALVNKLKGLAFNLFAFLKNPWSFLRPLTYQPWFMLLAPLALGVVLGVVFSAAIMYPVLNLVFGKVLLELGFPSLYEFWAFMASNAGEFFLKDGLINFSGFSRPDFRILFDPASFVDDLAAEVLKPRPSVVETVPTVAQTMEVPSPNHQVRTRYFLFGLWDPFQRSTCYTSTTLYAYEAQDSSSNWLAFLNDYDSFRLRQLALWVRAMGHHYHTLATDPANAATTLAGIMDAYLSHCNSRMFPSYSDPVQGANQFEVPFTRDRCYSWGN